MMTLERYSHVMHMTSQVSGRLRDGQDRDRRAAGHPAGGHGVGRPEGAGHGDHRRPRADQAGPLRRASSATSTSPATSTPPSPSARWWWTTTAGPRCRPGAGIVADSVPEHEDLECHNKARALLAAIPAARRMTARAAGPRRREPRRPPDSVRAMPGDRRPAHARRGASPIRRDVRRRARARGDRVPAGPAQPGRRGAGGRGLGPSLLLQPTGKVDAWLRVTRLADDDGPARRRRRAAARPCSRGCARFKLRTKADARAGHAGRGSRCAAPAPSRHRPGAGARLLPSGWPGVDGVDLLAPGGAASAGLPLVGADGARGAPHRGRRAGDGRRAHRRPPSPPSSGSGSSTRR